MNLCNNIFKVSPRKISLLLLFIVLSVSLYLRLAPAYFPQFRSQARAITEQKIADASSHTLSQKYPGYGVRARNALIKTIIKNEAPTKEFQASLLREYAALRAPYQDASGQTYLLELDPYQWMRNTENVLRYGFPGTKKIGNAIYDTYMLAPRGIEIGHVNFLFYCSAALYRVFSLFSPATTLEHFLFYMPLFYTALFLVILYYFCKQYFSSFGAFCATMYVGCNGMFINRSCAGWYDYDVLSMIMPLLIIGCLSACLRTGRMNGRYWLWLLGASFFLGLYTFTWIGWWFLPFIIFFVFLFVILNNYGFRPRHEAHHQARLYLVTLGGFFVFGAAFCFLISRVNMFAELFALLRENLTLGKSASTSIWPDVRYTISELQAASVKGITRSLYGGFTATLVIVALAWIYGKERRGRHAFVIFSMFFWAIFMAYASFRGARFIIYLIIPLGFFFGWAASEIVRYLRGKFHSHFKATIIGSAIFAGVFSFMFATFFQAGFIASRQDYPLMNDEWYEALRYARAHTPPGAILNSWWDYGDFFKTVADRPVIFDGQSQLGSLGYWMSRVLLAPSEYEALRILMMLNNASDNTFKVLNAHIPDQFLAQRVLEELLGCDRARGSRILQAHKVPDAAAREILDDLHTTPGAAYFVVDKSMAGKMANISFIGNWIFPKVFIAKNSALPQEEIAARLAGTFGVTAAQAKTYYEEVLVSGLHADGNEVLSRRFAFYTTPIVGSLQGTLVSFPNGVVHNIETKDTLMYLPREERYVRPSTVVLYQGGKKEVYTDPSGDFKKCIGIVKDADRYMSFVFDEGLIDALFTRLMFLRGSGLTHFKHFFTSSHGTVVIYQIQWPQAAEELDSLTNIAKPGILKSQNPT